MSIRFPALHAVPEYERKLAAPDGFELPDLGGAPLEPRVFTSVYHDTVDRSLARSGITLRRRTERGRSVWQLKLPAGDARLEVEEQGGPPLPESLAKLLVAHLRGGPVAPVADLRTRRHGSLVVHKGTTVEVTVDDVSVMDAHRVVEEFVEIEVELKEGKRKHVAAIAGDLGRAGARPTNGTPKLFRVLSLPRDEKAATPLDVLRRRLHAQLREILAHDPGTRLGRDPESLHDMRVAVRRTRALLRTCKPLYTGDLTAFTEELRWLSDKLGAVRDLDVLVDRLRAESRDLEETGTRQLLRALERRRSGSRRALARALESQRYLTLLDLFGAELDGLAPSGADVSLRQVADRRLRKLRTSARAIDDDAPSEALHALRKHGKRVRYAYELAGNAAAVRCAKALQDVLGEHQDSVVAETTLHELAAASPACALVAGRLIERERTGRRDVHRAWRRELKQLTRAAT